MTDYVEYVDTDYAGGSNNGDHDTPWVDLEDAWEATDSLLDPGDTATFFVAGATADTTRILVDTWPSSEGAVTLNFYPWDEAFGAASTKDDGWAKDTFEDANTDDGIDPNYWVLDLAAGASQGIFDLDCTYGSAGQEINVEGLQFQRSGNQIARVFSLLVGLGGDINFRGNRISDISSGTFPRIWRIDSSLTDQINLTCENNLIVYTGANQQSVINNNDAQCDGVLVNNTVIYSDASISGSNLGAAPTGSAWTLINNALRAPAASDIDFAFTDTPTFDYNATPNSADRGSNGFALADADFVNYRSDITPDTEANQTNDWGYGGETQDDNSLIPAVDAKGQTRNTGTGEATAIGCLVPAAGEAAGHTAAAAYSVGPATLAASAHEHPSAAAALTIEPVDLSTTGALSFTAAAALTIEPVDLSTTGALSFTAAAALTIEEAVLAANAGLETTAAAGLDISVAELAAQAEQPHAAAVAAGIAVAELAADASHGNVHTGAAALEIVAATLAAIAEQPHSAAAGLTVGPATLAVQAEQPHAGVAAQFVMFDEGIYNILIGNVDLDDDTFKVALTNSAPSAAVHDELADITEIGTGTGYSAGGQALDNVTLAESGAGTGIWNWTFDSETFLASGGTMGPFRYLAVYSDTSTGDKLIGYVDHGSAVSISDSNSFTMDMSAGPAIKFQEG